VVLHAGIVKAGSSSIQRWLGQHQDSLRAAGICIVAARVETGGTGRGVWLTECQGGSANSSLELQHIYQFPGPTLRPWAVQDLLHQLDEAATRHRVVVMSAEALQYPFSASDSGFLAGLEELGSKHRVRVAYYVRPQHTALEAHWRESGFRTELRPTEYVADQLNHFHYFDTWTSVSQLAPSVSFEVRPFRPDLLDLGNPDFARRFLDPPSNSGPIWANRGLPLEVANAFHSAPAGRFWLSPFWASPADVRTLGSMKALFRDLQVTESEDIGRSRRVLQAYCHETFEPANARLIEALGWETDAFVPAVPSVRGDETDIDALDSLWTPRASAIELEALYTAFERVISFESRVSQAEQSFASPPKRAAKRRKDAVHRRAEKAERRAEKAERRHDELEAELATARRTWSFELSNRFTRLIGGRRGRSREG